MEAITSSSKKLVGTRCVEKPRLQLLTFDVRLGFSPGRLEANFIRMLLTAPPASERPKKKKDPAVKDHVLGWSG